MKIGLEHLNDYLEMKGNIIIPKVLPRDDFKNYIMLYYYKNPLCQIFFNEGIVLVAMHTFGMESCWETGVNLDQVFEKACFLADLLEHEEFLDKRIMKSNRDYFDRLIQFMIQKRILIKKDRDPQSS